MDNNDYFKKYGYANKPLKLNLGNLVLILEGIMFLSCIIYAIVTFHLEFAIIGWGLFITTGPILAVKYGGQVIEIFPKGVRSMK